MQKKMAPGLQAPDLGTPTQWVDTLEQLGWSLLGGAGAAAIVRLHAPTGVALATLSGLYALWQVRSIWDF